LTLVRQLSFSCRTDKESRKKRGKTKFRSWGLQPQTLLAASPHGSGKTGKMQNSMVKIALITLLIFAGFFVCSCSLCQTGDDACYAEMHRLFPDSNNPGHYKYVPPKDIWDSLGWRKYTGDDTYDTELKKYNQKN